MRTLLMIGLLVVTLVCGRLAGAYPTLTGPSGLAVLPDGLLSSTGIKLAADWHDMQAGESVPIRAIFVLGPGVEVGGVYDPYQSDDAPFSQTLGANAKLRFGRLLGGRAAVGGQWLGNEFGTGSDEEYLQGYVAWTTDMNGGGSSLSLTLGANWTQFTPVSGDEVEDVRFFAGVVFELAPGVQFIGEYQTKSEELGDVDPITALTARIALGKHLAVQVGSTNAFQLIGTDAQHLFVGLAIQ